MTLAISFDPKSDHHSPAFQATDVLSKHGKSFYFAGRFLPLKQFKACARLYSFCRYLDDVVDASLQKPDALKKLIQIANELDSGMSFDPVISDFLMLSREYQINHEPVRQLIQGLLSDLDSVLFEDDAQLKLYCYRVAGTVGLLMCDVLGVEDTQAHKHAIDLGIAMQLTNIARDVAEDARNNRRYLPKSLVGNLNPLQIANADVWHRDNLKTAVKILLDDAEYFYESAERGMAYLPWRVRLAILIAARVYRGIGRQLARKKYATWLGRAQVTTRGKIMITVKACFDFITRTRFHLKTAQHNPVLHQPIQGVPGSYGNK
ncbi:MAG: phytoene/squalene synthase family protein [Gammaproteobacteria bacterium]|nr:phytoene/squalene synthase family protein [Gammaproteobacteria bacterium]